MEKVVQLGKGEVSADLTLTGPEGEILTLRMGRGGIGIASFLAAAGVVPDMQETAETNLLAVAVNAAVAGYEDPNPDSGETFWSQDPAGPTWRRHYKGFDLLASSVAPSDPGAAWAWEVRSRLSGLSWGRQVSKDKAMAVAEAFALQASGQLGNALALVDDDVEDVIPPPECSLPQLAAMFERRSSDCKKLAGPQPDSDNGFDLASRQFFGYS